MTRDPRWTDAQAAEFLALIEADDGPDAPFVFTSEGSTDAEGATAGALDSDPATFDAIDFVEVELSADAVYTFLAFADGREIDLTIFDDEGYLLLFTDAGSFGIEQDGTDTIYQFLPDESGTYYLGLFYIDDAASGPYEVAGVADFGEPTPGGNTAPVAIDGGLLTPRFATAIFEPASDDLDADGDALTVTAIAEPPENGVAFVVDGQVLYRSDRDFTGTDSFRIEVSDGQGGADLGNIFVTVGEETDPRGVTLAVAQSVAYLYEAALDRDGGIDEPGLNFWIGEVADGLTQRGLAQAFLTAPEFTAAFGEIDTLTDEQYVDQLYLNVLEREGDPDGREFFVQALADGAGRDEVLIAFAESNENMVGSPEVATLTETEDGSWVFGDVLG